jgi:signal transduction histidine kinase
MLDFLKNLLDSDFMAHGYCYLWRPEIVWLHVVSDALITLAYYSIPITLIYFVRKRRDLPFHWMFLMFGAFILGCGTTHAMEVWTIWHGTYRLAGIIKLVTAGMSVSTALALVPLMPKALALPSPSRLEAANRELKLEITNREHAEREIHELNENLERRVVQRTAQLEAVNQELQQEIAQRKRVEEVLLQQTQELARSNAALQQFAYASSHDLKEPLRNITLFSQALSKHLAGSLDATGQDYLNFVATGAKRMNALVDALLSYSLLTNVSEADYVEVDLNACAKIAINNLRYSITESSATVHLNHLPSPVWGDELLLTQVFQNLLSNAIKYCEHDAAPEITISASNDGGEWIISVADNGIGIPAEYYERIFGLFKRLHNSDYPGTGIGLAMCKKIVEKHGGRIWVESGGRGSTFKFVIVTRTAMVAKTSWTSIPEGT